MDKRYRDCLMRGLMSRDDKKLPLVEFTSPDSILVFAAEKKLALLLVSDMAVTDEILKADIGRIVLLCEDPEMGGDTDEFGYIFKYQPVARIAADLWYEYISISPTVEEIYPKAVSSHIYGIYSPVKRCFKTGFSIALAAVLGENSRVLLVSFEENSVLEEMMDFSDSFSGENLSDALYYYLQGNLAEHMRELVRNAHGFDFILPTRTPEDLESLTPDNVTEFIRYLLYECHYANVVVDFGDRLDKICRILPCCEKIFMPTKPDWVSEAKKGHFLEYVTRVDEGLMTRIREVNPPRRRMSTDRKAGASNFETMFTMELLEYVRTCI